MNDKFLARASLAAFIILLALFAGCHWPGVDNPDHKVHYPANDWHAPITTNAP